MKKRLVQMFIGVTVLFILTFSLYKVAAFVPVTNNDEYVMNQNTTLVVTAPGVLANDSPGLFVRGELDDDPRNGSVNISGDGSFTYTPNPGFVGTDTFKYRASDGSTSAGGLVTIIVNAANQPPIVNNDSYSTTKNTTLTVAAPGVLGNDRDPDSVSFSAVLASNVTRGTLSFNANGSFTYSPSANFFGTDSFTYRATDGNSNSGIVTVTITVAQVPAQALAVSGKRQFAAATRRFSEPLIVRVLDNAGIPVANASVTFSAPAAGASCTLEGATTVTTNGLGMARINAIAGQPGTYTVTASVSGGAGVVSATYLLTNLNSCTNNNLVGAPNSPFILPVGKAYTMATGDFNNDGRLDYVIGNDDTFVNNRGSEPLEKGFVVALSGDSGPTFVTTPLVCFNCPYPSTLTVADLNIDGNLDLVFNTGSNVIYTILGNGNGTFATNTLRFFSLPGVSFRFSNVGDFNNDGIPDVASVHNSSNPSGAYILLGNGDGSLRAGGSAPVGRYPGNTAPGDFNGDGKLDLAVANNSSSNVSVLLGDGNGNLQAAAPITVGEGPTDIVTSDFNNDGKQDIAVTNYYTYSVTILLGAGNGTFTASVVALPTYYRPFNLARGDLNGDGKMDLALTAGNTGGNYQIYVLVGNGSGGFQQFSSPLPKVSNEIAIGDFNNNGRLDLAALLDTSEYRFGGYDPKHSIAILLDSGCSTEASFGFAVNDQFSVGFNSNFNQLPNLFANDVRPAAGHYVEIIPGLPVRWPVT